ncbi:MAG: hypothetical protein P8189_12035, partial [Anaerolineae bacterium]
MLTLMMRHLRQHWRLNLALFLGLTLAATMMAGLQIYADAIGTQGLHQTIASYTAPPARNILISASEGTRLDERAYSRMKGELGGVLAERIDVGMINVPVYERPPVVVECRSARKLIFV